MAQLDRLIYAQGTHISGIIPSKMKYPMKELFGPVSLFVRLVDSLVGSLVGSLAVNLVDLFVALFRICALTICSKRRGFK